MKNIALTISLTLLSLLSLAQLDSLSKNVLESLIRKQHPAGTLYYTDRLGKEAVSRIKATVKNKSFFATHRESENDTIYLSPAEQRLMSSEINTWNKVVWKDALFTNSKSIPEDSMWARIQKKNKEIFDNYYKDTSAVWRDQFINRLVDSSNTFQFSPPIFLRNKSIVLAYIFRLCGGLCGEYELTFYKLENGVYKKWILVTGGVF